MSILAVHAPALAGLLLLAPSKMCRRSRSRLADHGDKQHIVLEKLCHSRLEPVSSQGFVFRSVPDAVMASVRA